MKRIKVVKPTWVIRSSVFGSCIICKRPLKRPESMARGMGPVCAARQAAKEQTLAQTSRLLPEALSQGFIFKRLEDGRCATNIPQLVILHSPDGFECGYGGSGPADAALNIVEIALRRIGYRGEKMGCFQKTECFREAFRLHQEFKREFVASLPREGGTIPYTTAVNWVQAHIHTEPPYRAEPLLEAT